MSEITAPNFNIKTGEIIPPQPAAIPAATISKRTASSIARRWIYDHGAPQGPGGNYSLRLLDCDGIAHEVEADDLPLIRHYLVKQEKRIRTYLGVTK